MHIQADRLVQAGATIFEASGSSSEEAKKVARRLVDANLTGHDSHGVIRIPQYIDAVKDGSLQPNRQAKVMSDSGAVVVLDGQFGYGQIVGEQTIDAAIEKARLHGIGMATLRNAGHLGRIGDWAARAAALGMTSLNFVNAIGHQPIVVPHGGAEPRGSTNPIAIGVPVEGEDPIILDFATSAVAEGKVRVARNKGTYLPPDCLLDADGQPTTDPTTLYGEPRSHLLPFGGAVTGHKGGGLWLMADLLAGGLSIGGCAREPEEKLELCSNMLSIAINPEQFADSNAINAEVKRYIAFIKSSRPRDPKKPVMLPGDPERKAMAERSADGINVDPETWAQIAQAGQAVGVSAEKLESLVV
ncbi:MAG: malate/lactate/ureidoglycolate dehydrogenase [Geminicoccaceae bacterium]